MSALPARLNRHELCRQLRQAADAVRSEIPALRPLLRLAAHEIWSLELRLNAQHGHARIMRDRQILRLRDKGYLLREIAAKYGITTPRVHKILQRAEEERAAARWDHDQASR